MKKIIILQAKHYRKERKPRKSQRKSNKRIEVKERKVKQKEVKHQRKKETKRRFLLEKRSPLLNSRSWQGNRRDCQHFRRFHTNNRWLRIRGGFSLRRNMTPTDQCSSREIDGPSTMTDSQGIKEQRNRTNRITSLHVHESQGIFRG
jgi:hypothetical protein